MISTRRMNGTCFESQNGSILVTVTLAPGHVNPLLAIAGPGCRVATCSNVPVPHKLPVAGIGDEIGA
jgi:hypothetical protein